MLAFECHIDGGRVGEIDVQPAIAVVVKQQHAATHRLHDVSVVRSRGVREMNTSLVCNVFQLRDRPVVAFDDLQSRWRGRALGYTLSQDPAWQQKMREQ